MAQSQRRHHREHDRDKRLPFEPRRDRNFDRNDMQPPRIDGGHGGKKDIDRGEPRKEKIIVDPPPKFDINQVGPHPGFIEPCRRFVFEHQIQRNLKKLGTVDKDENWRMQGVQFIDSTRSALRLPTKALNTAATLFHRFRLQYSLDEYPIHDVCASALYLASKIEETAKRPNQIVCAGHNINLPPSEQRQPEDEFFDSISNRVVDLERLILEASTFEFETRHPQALTTKIMQVEFGMELSNPDDRQILHTAWYISMDLNYTFALLKNVTQALALASVELAFRLLGEVRRWETIFPDPPGDSDQSSEADINNPYKKFYIFPDPVYETMFDLLDLYTTHRAATFAGPSFSLDTIMAVRIDLNERAAKLKVPRYAHWRDDEGRVVTPQYVYQLRTDIDGSGDNISRQGRDDSSSLPSPTTGTRTSPTSPTSGGEQPKKQVIAVRRFVLQPEEAEKELRNLDKYFLTLEEEYGKDYEVSDGWETVEEDEDGDELMKDPPKERFKDRRR